jgi:hypothetical protein
METNASGTGDGLTPEQRMELERMQIEKTNAQRTLADAQRTSTIALYVVVGVVVLAAIICIATLIQSQSEKIADVDYARGLITVLFSVVVVLIAVILVLNTLLKGPGADPTESGNQFQRAKEVLSLMLGILGTVVGFYFGTTSNPKVRAEIASAVIANDNLAPGETLSLDVQLVGATPPNFYRLEFAGIELPVQADRADANQFNVSVPLPADAAPGTFDATLEIIDSAGKRIVYPEKLSFTITSKTEETAGGAAPNGDGKPDGELSEPTGGVAAPPPGDGTEAEPAAGGTSPTQ